jgi:hypothetical protein
MLPEPGAIMKSYFPFTDYDFWAYISSGFVFLFVLDHSLQTDIFQRPTWTIVEGLIAVAAAYVVGHLLAGVASAVLERRLVGNWLGRPSITLLGVQRGPRWFRVLYPSFYEPLPSSISDLVLKQGRAYGVTEPGEAIFWLAYDRCRKNKTAMRRLESFLNLYGLCRNLSFTAFLCAVLLCIEAWWNGRTSDYLWAIASAVLAAGMLLRYLKFYRHYSLEVLTTFAHAKDSVTKVKEGN